MKDREPHNSEHQEAPRARRLVEGALFVVAGLGLGYIAYITMRDAAPIFYKSDPRVVIGMIEFSGGALAIGYGIRKIQH